MILIMLEEGKGRNISIVLTLFCYQGHRARFTHNYSVNSKGIFTLDKAFGGTSPSDCFLTVS